VGSTYPSNANAPASDAQAGLAMERNSDAMAGNLSRYHSWCLSQFPIPQNARLLDLGCGRCLYFDQILKYRPTAYIAADYSQDNIEYLEKLFGYRSGFQVQHADLTSKPSMEKLGGLELDCVFCFDVLEHIEDDLEALLNIRSLMLKTGAKRLFLKVPAMPGIYGRTDHAIGHYRRYSRFSLNRILLQASLKLHSLKYQNMPGIIPWFLFGRVLKRSNAVTSGESKMFDRVVPLIKAVETIITPPFGLSLNAIAIPA
jgi:SAM-dependent methyltransferase